MQHNFKVTLESDEDAAKQLEQLLAEEVKGESLKSFKIERDTCSIFDGYHPITSVHREDIGAVGFNVTSVTGEIMDEIAGKLADAYLDNVFWEDLKIIAEDLNIPKKAKK